MTRPTEPPEKRPSVINPTIIFLSLHKVVILEVESSISGIPGPPTGPSYLTTTISLLLKLSGSFSRVQRSFCSPSNILAFPIKTLFSKPPSTPASFKIELNSGDKFPPKSLSPPVSL